MEIHMMPINARKKHSGRSVLCSKNDKFQVSALEIPCTLTFLEHNTLRPECFFLALIGIM